MRITAVTVLGVAVALSIAWMGAACRTAPPRESPTATTAPPPTATSGTPSTATTATTPDAAVLAAYARYWDVYSDALLKLDERRLEEVMTAARLERALEELRTLRAQGRAVQIVVSRQPFVAAVDETRAVVIDQYRNESYLVDTTTKQPIGERGEPQTIQDTFTLMRVGGIWKVSDSTRQAGR